MTSLARRCHALCLAFFVVSPGGVACDPEPARAPQQEVPEQQQAPPPGVDTRKAPLQTPSKRDEDIFLTGTPEQRDMLVAMRTLMLSEADDAQAVKVLTELFYSEPASLVQLGAGVELARALIDLEQREAAENVLDELEAAEIDPDYGALLWIHAARLRAEMTQTDRALALYERVLEHRPEYGFLLAEIARIPGTDADVEARYRAWRDARIEELGSGEVARAKALELLLMAQHDHEVERALRALLKEQAKLDERASARITMWLETHGAVEEETQQGEGDDEAR